MSTEIAPRLFISYARRDADFVDRLSADLAAREIYSWVDRRTIEGGQDWEETLLAAIDRAECILVVLSPEALQSQWVERECAHALSAGKRIVPLHYRHIPQTPPALEKIQWVDFEHGYSSGLKRLLAALSRSAVSTEVTAAALKDLYVQGVEAAGKGDLERVAVLWQQVVDVDPDYLNGTVERQLREMRPSLAEARIRRLRQEATTARRAADWRQELAAWEALLEYAPYDFEARHRLPIARRRRRDAPLEEIARAVETRGNSGAGDIRGLRHDDSKREQALEKELGRRAYADATYNVARWVLVVGAYGICQCLTIVLGMYLYLQPTVIRAIGEQPIPSAVGRAMDENGLVYWSLAIIVSTLVVGPFAVVGLAYYQGLRLRELALALVAAMFGAYYLVPLIPGLLGDPLTGTGTLGSIPIPLAFNCAFSFLVSMAGVWLLIAVFYWLVGQAMLTWDGAYSRLTRLGLNLVDLRPIPFKQGFLLALCLGLVFGLLGPIIGAFFAAIVAGVVVVSFFVALGGMHGQLHAWMVGGLLCLGAVSLYDFVIHPVLMWDYSPAQDLITVTPTVASILGLTLGLLAGIGLGATIALVRGGWKARVPVVAAAAKAHK